MSHRLGLNALGAAPSHVPTDPAHATDEASSSQMQAGGIVEPHPTPKGQIPDAKRAHIALHEKFPAPENRAAAAYAQQKKDAAPSQQQRVNDKFDAIHRLTRPTDVQRQADPNYRLVVASNLRSSQYKSAESGLSQKSAPHVRPAQAVGFFDEMGENLSIAARSLLDTGTSLAAEAWRSNHEIKIGAALYDGVGGNVELTCILNPSRLRLSVSEFEWGLGFGMGLKTKAGWTPLKEEPVAPNIPIGTLKKFGSGQAEGTGAISVKGGLELSAPGVNFVVAEGRVGVQSPLAGTPDNAPRGAFYEVKVGELKIAPVAQVGATVKVDIFNNAYKFNKP